MSYLSECEELQISHKDKVLDIYLNRPQKKNALNLAMYQGLTQALLEAKNNPDISVIYIHGSDSCFTSGNDIQDFLTMPITDEDHPIVNFLFTLAHCKKPIVAAVAGPAIGIGTTLLLHCDLIFAAPNAMFQLPFIHLGLCPEAGSSLLLPRMMGHPKAAELLLLGEPFSAEQAQTLGIINDICDGDTLFEKTQTVISKLTSKPVESLQLTKGLLKKPDKRQLNDTIRLELEHIMQCLSSPQAKAAFEQFLKKS